MSRKHGGLTPEQLERAKCEDSPTGAHHWMLDSHGHGTCKHCHETREFRTGWQDSGFRSQTGGKR